MPKNIKGNNWKKQRQKEYIERREYRYYIFCEGEKTEPQYFKGFKELIEKTPLYRDMVLIQIEGGAGETLYILDQAKKFVKKNNISNSHVWCVYDRDDFLAGRFDQVEESIETLNKEPKDGVYYHAAWSNQCIEFWFILHFSYYHSNTDRMTYIEYLDVFCKAFFGESCKIFLEKIASPFWRKLQRPVQSLREPQPATADIG